MRKIVLLILINILILNFTYSEGLNLKIGSLSDQVKDYSTTSDDESLANATNIDVSIDLPLTDELDFGVGYEVYNGKNFQENDLSFKPVYFQFKYNAMRGEDVNPYFLAKVGINLIEGASSDTANYESGPYYGFGMGVELNNFIIQLAADNQLISYTLPNNTYEMEISRMNLSFGYNLK